MEQLTQEQKDNAKTFDDIYPPEGAVYLGSEPYRWQTISGRSYYFRTPDGQLWKDDDQIRNLKIRRYLERKQKKS